MDKKQNYLEAAAIIKTAILQSQYAAARSVNEKQLMLYLRDRQIHLLKLPERILGESKS